jgi:hypothetical protein
MSITLTQFRNDLYKIIDQVIETGIPVEIERKGAMIQIVLVKEKSKLGNLTKHPGTIVGNPESLVHIDWFNEWQGRNQF